MSAGAEYSTMLDYYDLITELYEMGDYQEALNAYEDYLQLWNHEFELNFDPGILHENIGRVAKKAQFRIDNPNYIPFVDRLLYLPRKIIGLFK